MTPPLVVSLPQGRDNAARTWEALQDHCPRFTEIAQFAFQGNTPSTFLDEYPEELEHLTDDELVERQRLYTKSWLRRYNFLPDGKSIVEAWPNHEPEHEGEKTWLHDRGLHGYKDDDTRVLAASQKGIRLALMEEYGDSMASVPMSAFQIPTLLSNRTPEQTELVLRTGQPLVDMQQVMRVNMAARDYDEPTTAASLAAYSEWIMEQAMDTRRISGDKPLRGWFSPGYGAEPATFTPLFDTAIRLASFLRMGIGIDFDMRNDKGIDGRRTNLTHGIDMQIMVMCNRGGGEQSIAERLADWAESRA